MTALLRLPGHMCDARLWSALSLPLEQVDVDLGKQSSVQAMAEDALAAAASSFVVMGFSMGGIVALQLARIAGPRLKGLILVDTNPGAETPERQRMRERQQQAVRRGHLEQVVREELKPNYLASANRNRADLLDRTLDMALACGPAAFLAQAEALKTRPDAWDVLATLDVPVLVLCGAEDELCPPDLHARIAQACPRAELTVIHGAGHLLPLEQPAAMSEAIRDWASKTLIGEDNG